MRRVLSLALVFALVSAINLAVGAGGGEKPSPAPLYQPLWPDGAPGAKGKTDADIPAVMAFLPPADKANGTAIVILPGGGYGGLASDHEGVQIAKWANSLGAAGIVVRYRLGPKYHHPTQMHDAQRALHFTRAHAKEWGVDPAKVGIIGFSAGGHLASTTGTHIETGDAQAADPIDRLTSRPDFMILCYPVIRMTGPYAHVGSRNNLLGKDADKALVESLSNDTQVTKNTPPTFLVHTSEDTGVPPGNSVLFYQALVENKVPAELHIYEKGRHGLGLGQGTAFGSWPERCEVWLKGTRFPST